jgi:hypothetical protein
MMAATSHITPIDDHYETCEMTFAEFRIYGASLDLDFVSAYLGIQPTQSQTKGEVRVGHEGRESEIGTGGWFLSSEGHIHSKDLRRHLDWLLARLLLVKDKIIFLQNQEDIKMGVNCIWWSAFGDGGPTLWPEQMGTLADLNLECSFDISFFGNEEEYPDRT